MKKKNKLITAGWQQRRNSIKFWSIKYQVQYSPMYELNIVNAGTSWIRGSTLTTIKRLKSPKINILCCFGSSLINKIKSSMKEPRGPVIRYTISNKNVSPYISTTIGNNSKALGIWIISMFTLLTFEHKAMPCCIFLWMSFQLSRISSICFLGLAFILVSVK